MLLVRKLKKIILYKQKFEGVEGEDSLPWPVPARQEKSKTRLHAIKIFGVSGCHLRFPS